MRFEDTPELFGHGAGTSTAGDFTCDICGKEYNIGADEREEYADNISVTFTEFAGMNVGDCCFEIIEDEILSRMRDIIPWYRRYLDNITGRVAKMDNILSQIEGGKE